MLNNPYDYKFPIDTAEMFFGRRALLDEFIHNFTNPRPNSYYLVGGRRIGKTSLLHALSRELLAQPIHPAKSYALPLYLDMQFEAIETRRDFFICVQQLLYEALQTVNQALYDTLIAADHTPRLSQETSDIELLPHFEQGFSAIRQAAQAHMGELKVILLVDESERLLHKAWADDLMSNLRALLTNRLKTRYHLSIIMAGASKFYREISSEGSPLHNVLEKRVLSTLDVEAALRLVAEPTQGKLSAGATQEVLTQTGGHPYLTQYIMHRLWAADTLSDALPDALSDIGATDVQNIARTIWNTPETLEDWCVDIGPVGEAAYALIHPQEEWITWPGICQQLTEDRRELRRGVEALGYHGLIHYESRLGYRIAGAMFRDWFVTYRSKASSNEKNVPQAGPQQPEPEIIYHDFELLVTSDRQIRAKSETQGEAQGHLHLDMNAVAFYLNLIERQQTNRELLKSLGAALYGALFPNSVHALLRASIAQAKSENARIRLRLNIDVSELTVLPWELLYDDETHTFLANNTQTALSRYITVSQPHRSNSEIQLPLRILVIIASPTDLDALDIQTEEQLIREAFAKQMEMGQIEIDLLSDKSTVHRINQRLSEKEYHALHFIGHGHFQEDQGFIVVEDEDKTAHILDDETFGNLFLNHRSLRLAVLNACRAATQSDNQAFAGIAPCLIQRGVPAVVAMQYPIQDTTSLHFSDEFYRALALGWPIDAAIQSTRNMLSIQLGLDSPDFATPVLFMRAADGNIFGG